MHVTAADFIHPEDAAAQQQIRDIPLFDQFVKLFLKLGPEQLYHNQYMSQAIRLGPRQLPEVYQHLVECCGILEVEVPEMYLEGSPAINAFSLGDTRRFVVVTAGLLEACDEDELHAVIAHECGHLVCRHTFYRMMMHLLVNVGTQVFGPLAAAAAPIQLALAYWARRGELSADRAAAVVLGGSRPVVETMIRLAGGPKSVTGAVDIDEYVKQAAAYDELGQNQWDKVLQLYSVGQVTHPFSAVRAREIIQWCEGEQYRRIMDGLARVASGPRCPACSRPIADEWKFCRSCGESLADAAAARQPAAAAAGGSAL